MPPTRNTGPQEDPNPLLFNSVDVERGLAALQGDDLVATAEIRYYGDGVNALSVQTFADSSE